MNRLLSHPNQYLADHLRGIFNIVEKYLAETELPFINDKVKLIIKYAVLFHDFGKSTSYFQDFISDTSKKTNNSKLKSHSAISAVVAFKIAKKELDINNNDDRVLLIALLSTIARHHGNMLNPSDIIYNLTSEESIKLITEQSKKINYFEYNKILQSYNLDLPEITEEFVIQSLEDLKSSRMNLTMRFLNKLHKEEFYDNDYYILINLIYSILISSDKLQASLQQELPIRIGKIENNLTANYIKEKFSETSDINNLRNQAFLESESNILKSEKCSIFSLTLPTGTGKTLNLLNLAIKLRNLRNEQEDYYPRIIYALPFISVIDQNYNVFEKVLSNLDFNDSRLLAKHHSLADINYLIKNDKSRNDLENNLQYNANQSETLIGNWHSEIICTTFIQLFNSLISNKNSDLQRFNKIPKSIIILDELQQIGIEYWKLIEYILKKANTKLNCDIILVTATQPAIFADNEIIPLVEKQKYFSQMDRIKIHFNLEKQTIKDFINDFEIDLDKSYLFILNTIASAKEFYKKLSEKIDDDICFLSTHITPFERLNKIKEIKDGKYKFAVSTQLVEAGVDIDFNVVVRDFAPIDSIVQAAGRCNRNDSEILGEMYVVKLTNENLKPYSSQIYSAVNLDISEKVIEDKSIIKESEINDLIDNYFKLAKERNADTKSMKYIRAINCLKYDSEETEEEPNFLPISDFKLIDNDYYKLNVFVEIDEKAVEIRNNYIKFKTEQKNFENKYEFLAELSKYEKKLNDYTIQIPQKCDNIPILLDNIYVVPYNQLDDYYDMKTGFITKGANPIW